MGVVWKFCTCTCVPPISIQYSRAARDRKTTYNTYPVNLLCIMNYVIQSLARRVRQNFIDMYTNFSGLSYNIFAWGNF